MLRRILAALTVAIVLLAVAPPAQAQAWAGRGRAQGLVKDEQGRPIEGAKITLRKDDPDDGPEPVYTDAKGRWIAAGLAGGAWTAVIEKEGYVTGEGPVSVNEFGAAQMTEVVLPANPFASIDRGEALFEQGDYAAARAEYEKAIPNLEPDRAAALRSRIGDAYLAEGDPAAARAQYELALPDISAEGKAHVLLQVANTYQREENWTAARQTYEQVLPLLSSDGQAQVLLQIARTHDVEDNRAAAISTLERALELDPDNAATLQLIADLLAREGRDAESEAYLARIPADAELPPDMLLNAGIRHYNDGDLEGALAQFDRVLAQDPSVADAYYYRGLTYLGLQRNDEARADLTKFLELAPDSPQAADAREFLSFLGQGQ